MFKIQNELGWTVAKHFIQHRWERANRSLFMMTEQTPSGDKNCDMVERPVKWSRPWVGIVLSKQKSTFEFNLSMHTLTVLPLFIGYFTCRTVTINFTFTVLQWYLAWKIWTTSLFLLTKADRAFLGWAIHGNGSRYNRVYTKRQHRTFFLAIICITFLLHLSLSWPVCTDPNKCITIENGGSSV